MSHVTSFRIYRKHSTRPSTFGLWVHTYCKLSSCKSVLTVSSYRVQSNEIYTYGRVSCGSLPRVRRHGLLYLWTFEYGQFNTVLICDFGFSQWSMDPLRPSDANKHQLNNPSLVQIMAFCQFSTKPLSEAKMAYCELGPWEQISMNFKWNCDFNARKCIENVLSNMAAILFRPCGCTYWELNDIDGLVQEWSISIANALEILQSCTKPSIESISNKTSTQLCCPLFCCGYFVSP